MRRAIAGFGRTLVTLGLLMLLFVGYQLWGTGYFTARAQASLEDDFAQAQADYRAQTADDPVVDTSATTGPTTTTTTVPAPLPIPAEGDVVGGINIEKIDVHKWFVQGTERADLKKGPGHYPETVMPGQLGNAAIAGHRTTYGAPFNRLDELHVGDEIVVTLPNGNYTYKVSQEPFAVKPTETSVVANTPDRATLTLTTCNPKYSARERLVIKADLVENVSPPVVDPKDLPEASQPVKTESHDAALEDGLQGEQKALGPAWGWGLLVLVVGMGWWWVYRRWRHPAMWALGVV
ncbi:MAG TPA: class E sortase, partial [Acidimicrobiia bacterium]|nr:class E sortase [Acidimicrobiia bacterium]